MEDNLVLLVVIHFYNFKGNKHFINLVMNHSSLVHNRHF